MYRTEQRFDMGLEVDLIEELARIIDYDAVPSQRITTLFPHNARDAALCVTLRMSWSRAVILRQ